MDDVDDSYRSLAAILPLLSEWKRAHTQSYRDAFVALRYAMSEAFRSLSAIDANAQQ